jgi:hypothetical protein
MGCDRGVRGKALLPGPIAADAEEEEEEEEDAFRGVDTPLLEPRPFEALGTRDKLL